jgi:hypothetical protein
MEPQDDLREVKIHAISLSRPRRRRAQAPKGGTARAATAKVWAIAAPALSAPHHGVLALLGLSSLAIKTSRSTWGTLVAEGSRVEATLRRRVASAVDSISLPRLGAPAEAEPATPDNVQG